MAIDRILTGSLRYKGMTTTERNSLSVPAGEFWTVYNTDTGVLEKWSGTSWVGDDWIDEKNNVPRLDGTNTFSGVNTFSNSAVFSGGSITLGTSAFVNPQFKFLFNGATGGNWIEYTASGIDVLHNSESVMRYISGDALILSSNTIARIDASSYGTIGITREWALSKFTDNNSDYKYIDDAFVYKGANSGATIEVGDIIKRYPTSSRYIHARVDSLPYTDDANLTFFQDQTLI